MKQIAAALTVALSIVTSALAADQAPPAQPTTSPDEAIAVQAWGKTHPTCAQWTDGCVVCTGDGCSTPGIACTPHETSCAR